MESDKILEREGADVDRPLPTPRSARTGYGRSFRDRRDGFSGPRNFLSRDSRYNDAPPPRKYFTVVINNFGPGSTHEDVRRECNRRNLYPFYVAMGRDIDTDEDTCAAQLLFDTEKEARRAALDLNDTRFCGDYIDAQYTGLHLETENFSGRPRRSRPVFAERRERAGFKPRNNNNNNNRSGTRRFLDRTNGKRSADRISVAEFDRKLEAYMGRSSDSDHGSTRISPDLSALERYMNSGSTDSEPKTSLERAADEAAQSVSY